MGGSKIHLLLSWHRKAVRGVLPMYKYCMSVKKRPLPEITHFFLTIVAQLRNCSIVHFILETDMAKKCRSSKLQFDSIFCILHCSFCISLELLSFHSFKVWKVSGLGFNAANRSSFHFPKSLFGDIAIICLWYIWGKFKLFQKTKALSTLISN